MGNPGVLVAVYKLYNTNSAIWENSWLAIMKNTINISRIFKFHLEQVSIPKLISKLKKYVIICYSD